MLDDKRTSLIIDPPDGRLPPLTPEGQYRLATGGRGGTGGREGGKADGPEDRSTLERCITQGLPTSNLPTLYNNNVAIYQSPGYVALVHEMVHETRIVPLDGRPVRSPDPPVDGQLARPLGRRHARRRHHEFLEQDELPRVGSGDAHRRALYASRRQVGRRRNHGRGSRHVGPAVDRGVDDAPEQGPIFEVDACHEANMGLRDILEVARDEDAKSEKAADAAGGSDAATAVDCCSRHRRFSRGRGAGGGPPFFFAAEFDAKAPVTLKGTVTQMDWVNPHSWIHLEVKNPDGSVTTWMIEGGTPNTLLREASRRIRSRPARN